MAIGALTVPAQPRAPAFTTPDSEFRPAVGYRPGTPEQLQLLPLRAEA